MKRTKDLEKGRKDREKWAEQINHYLDSSYALTPLHKTIPEEQKKWSVKDKQKNNTLKNRITSGVYKGMGLFYSIESDRNYSGSIIIFGCKNPGGFYIKMPSEYISTPINFLKTLQDSYNTKVIIVEEQKEKILFSNLIDLSVFIEHWNPNQGGKGNKNRIQFHGPLKEIVCRCPNEVDLYGDSLINQLQQLAVL